jgi:hypothetical protein
VSGVIYLLALIGLVTVVVLFWKAFGPQMTTRSSTRVTGPDDDPDFLWRMSRQQRNRPDKQDPK